MRTSVITVSGPDPGVMLLFSSSSLEEVLLLLVLNSTFWIGIDCSRRALYSIDIDIREEIYSIKALIVV